MLPTKAFRLSSESVEPVAEMRDLRDGDEAESVEDRSTHVSRLNGEGGRACSDRVVPASVDQGR